MEEHGPTTEPQAIGADDRDLVPGDKVGEYVVEAKIGEGGFGTVFRAAHPLIGKLVAIKVLARQYSAQPEMVSRFVAEARAVNQIRHRNIIDIFAFGQLADGRHYYVMELLDGQPLDEHLAQAGWMPLEEALPILRALARALDAAHGKGIAHRDLKPENVFLARETDGTVFPKLLDFGIAKLLGASSTGALHKTRTGAPIGTPFYMSPEQCRGRDVDHRTDIYAFGIVAFKLLTGKVPFDGEDYMDVLLKQIHEAPPLASTFNPALPSSVDEGIIWMMQKDVAARPPNLITAVRALEDAATAAGVRIPRAETTGVHTAASRPSTHTPSATPSGLNTLPRSRRESNLGSAATVDAAKLSDAIAAVQPAITPGSMPPAPAPRRTGLIALAVAGAVAVGIAAFVVVRSQALEPAPGPALTPPSEPAAPRVPSPRGAAPTSPPAPPATAAPALVTLTIAGPPAGTEVIGPGGRLLGIAPGPIQLDASEQDVVLTFRADGYVARSMPVRPDADRALTVELEARPTAPAAAPERPRPDRPRPRPEGTRKNRDTIEDPFKTP